MLLLDQNLSRKLIHKLASDFTGICHVIEVNLERATDKEIWDYAKNHNLCITTQDSDFEYLSEYFNFPPKVIRITSGNQTSKQIENILIHHKEKIKEFIKSDNEGYLEIY
jgi:predicted nuclease of predicted toxin-antitoxin system